MWRLLIGISLLCLAHARFTNPLLSRGFGRIVNGDIVEPNSIPYQVAIRSRYPGHYRTFCGGSLISTNYVLTAAHCVEGAQEVEVVLGAHHVRDDEDTQVRMVSLDFIVHAGWDSSIGQHDIAIVKLPRPAPLNKYIQLVSLPTLAETDQTFNLSPAIATGWGDLGDDGATEEDLVLRKVELTIISNLLCGYAYPGAIQEGQICAKGDNRGLCSGDSGGPLVVKGNKQVGIASFVSDRGCESGLPAGFCRVSKYLDWISENSDVEIF